VLDLSDGLPAAPCYPGGVAEAPSPFALLLGAAFAAASGFALASVWIRHRRAIARSRARWAALAARRSWHLVERSGSFAVIGHNDGVSFHISQGAVAHGEIGVFLETRLVSSPWMVCELFASQSPLALTARRPGERVPLGDGKTDAGLELWSTHRTRALRLCDDAVRMAFIGLPRPYLLYQNGIVVLIWPCTSLPGDAQLDAALTCLAGLVRAGKSFGP
jgi:hypothetical protein